MTWEQAYELNKRCAIALIFPPGGEYDPYPQGQIDAHVETTLAAAKRVMIAEGRN